VATKAGRKAPAGCFWKGSVLYGRVKVKGRKPIKWSLRTSDVAIAKRRHEEEKKRLIGKVYYGEDNPTTFEAVLEKWGTNLVKSGSSNTHTRYFCSMDQIKSWLIGKTMDQITRKLIWEIVDERQKKVTNATINRDLTALSALIEYAIARDWFGERANPVPKVMGELDEDRGPINLPHDDDIELVMSRCHHPYGDLMKAALLTGCRLSELTNAKFRDFDPKARTLTVTGKGNKKRVIDLSWNDGDKFFASLPVFAGKPWLFWRHENLRVRKDSERDPKFRGDELTDASQNFRRITNETETWCEENDRQFVRFVFHDLRHRHCVDYLKSGNSIYDLNKRVGHSTLKQTEEYLEHITPEQARIAKYGTGGATVAA
jgi:integrase/recombinase XerD